MSLLTKGIAATDEFNMLKKGESVAIGLSGGADSVALLFFVLHLKKTMKLSVSAIHINHNLRGDESQRDEDFCRKLCEKLSVTFYCESLDIKKLAKAEGLSVEECARNHRYRVFESYAPKGKIATAHTLSDSVETMIFNLTRGTGIDGLKGIPAVREKIIRPLIYATREDVEEYLADLGQSYVTDSTNMEPNYSRNLIRLKILPLLKEINPNLENQIANTIKLNLQDSQLLSAVTQNTLKAISIGENSYHRGKYLNLSKALRGRIVMMLLKNLKLEYSYNRIELMDEIVFSGTGGLQLSDSILLKVQEKSFGFTQKQVITEPFEKEVPINKGDLPLIVEVFPRKTVNLYLLEYEEIENYLQNEVNYLKNVIDYDRMDRTIILRSRKPADKFRLAGRKYSKSLKNLFQEAEIPLGERSETVIIAGEEKVFWIEGFGASEDYQITGDTKRALVIEITLSGGPTLYEK